MTSQIFYAPIQPRRSAVEYPTKSSLKKNTSYTNPPAVYTNRISCPTRQAFYKHIDEEANIVRQCRKKHTHRAASITCPFHQPERQCVKRSKCQSETHTHECENCRNRPSSHKHYVNVTRSFLDQEQLNCSVPTTLPAVRRQSPKGNRSPSPVCRRIATCQDTEPRYRSRESKRNSSFHNSNETMSGHLKYGVFRNGAGFNRKKKPRTPSNDYIQVPLTPEHPQQKAFQKEIFFAPRVRTPVFIVPPIGRPHPQYLSRSDTMHVDIKPRCMHYYMNSRKNIACRNSQTDLRSYRHHRMNGRANSVAKELIIHATASLNRMCPLKSYNNRSPPQVPSPNLSNKSRPKLNRNISTPLANFRNNRAVSPYQRENSCTWRKEMSHRNLADRHPSLTRKKDYPRSPPSPQTKNLTKRGKKSEEHIKYSSDRELANKRKAASSVNINRKSFFDCITGPVSPLQSCSPGCNSIRKSPLSMSCSYKTISPEFCSSPFNLETRVPIHVPLSLGAMSDIQSQTDRE